MTDDLLTTMRVRLSVARSAFHLLWMELDKPDDEVDLKRVRDQVQRGRENLDERPQTKGGVVK